MWKVVEVVEVENYFLDFLMVRFFPVLFPVVFGENDWTSELAQIASPRRIFALPFGSA